MTLHPQLDVYGRETAAREPSGTYPVPTAEPPAPLFDSGAFAGIRGQLALTTTED